jgi:hypothetical protein
MSGILRHQAEPGALIQEIDTYPAYAFFITAPSTGKSIRSSSPAVVHVDYTGGAAVDTTAVVSLTGLQFRSSTAWLSSGGRCSMPWSRARAPMGSPGTSPAT